MHALDAAAPYVAETNVAAAGFAMAAAAGLALVSLIALTVLRYLANRDQRDKRY
jgi:hypothetical protein